MTALKIVVACCYYVVLATYHILAINVDSFALVVQPDILWIVQNGRYMLCFAMQSLVWDEHWNRRSRRGLQVLCACISFSRAIGHPLLNKWSLLSVWLRVDVLSSPLGVSSTLTDLAMLDDNAGRL